MRSPLVNDLRDMTADEIAIAKIADTLDWPNDNRNRRIWAAVTAEAGRSGPMITDRQADWLRAYARARIDRFPAQLHETIRPKPVAPTKADDVRIEVAGPILDVYRGLARGRFSPASFAKQFAGHAGRTVADVDAGESRTVAVKGLRCALDLAYQFRRSMSMDCIRWLPILRVDVGTARCRGDVAALVVARWGKTVEATTLVHAWRTTGQLLCDPNWISDEGDGGTPFSWALNPISMAVANALNAARTATAVTS